jgi:hypothetical protein
MVLLFITAKRFLVAYFQTILINVLAKQIILKKKWPFSLALIHRQLSLVVSSHILESIKIESHYYNAIEVYSCQLKKKSHSMKIEKYGDNVWKTKFVKHVFLNLYLVRYDLFHTLLHQKKKFPTFFHFT